MSGNLSKTRLTGSGVRSHEPGFGGGNEEDLMSRSEGRVSLGSEFTSCGMASIHLREEGKCHLLRGLIQVA